MATPVGRSVVGRLSLDGALLHVFAAFVQVVGDFLSKG